MEATTGAEMRDDNYALTFGETLIVEESETDGQVAAEGDESKYGVELRTGNWQSESVLPACLEWSLALRQSVLEYEACGMVLSLGGRQHVEPEARYSSEQDKLFVPKLYPPLLGYPIPLRDRPYMFTVTEIPGTRGMRQSVLALRKHNSSWCFPSAAVKELSGGMARVMAEAYTETPLHAYTDIARGETKLLVGEDRAWTGLYGEQMSHTRHPGLYGLIHDNSLIDVTQDSGSSASSSDSRDPSKRRHNSAWNGFVDCTFTPASLEAGKIRSLVHGCRYRLLTGAVLDKVDLLLDVLCDRKGGLLGPSSGDWIIAFMGCYERASVHVVANIVGLWRSMRGHATPSLHVFVKLRLISIAVSPGCIMRPVATSAVHDPTTADKAQWVDSLTFGRPEMMAALGAECPPLSVPSQYVRTTVLLVPYAFYDQPPRPLLASSMSVQAVCEPRCEISSTIAPVHSCHPIVRTPLMQRVVDQIGTVARVNVPGFPLLTLFANMKGNYEDSVIVSNAVNTLQVFAHRGIVYHPVPPGVTELPKGRRLGEQDAWWRPYDDGTVIREGVSKAKTRYVAASVESKVLRLGDKIATHHGQKFVVSQILDEEQMPLCVCTVTGTKFRPHLVVAASSVHNRVTPGQIYEAYAGMAAVGTHSFDPRTVTGNLVTSELGSECKQLQPFTCNVCNEDGELVNSVEGPAVLADYGICHYWLLGHLARDKQHYMSQLPRSTSVPRGRLRGAAVRLGEMELHSMLEAGLIHTLSELSDTADLITVPVCTTCRRLSILCDCPHERQESTIVAVRSPLVKFDIHRAVYTANGQVSGLRVASSPGEPEHAFVAESFRYHT